MAAAKIDPDRQFDLVAVARGLEEAGRHPKVSGLIRSTVSAASAHEDLKEAEACLKILRRISDHDGDLELDDSIAGSIAGSLFDHAIILYMRATQTSSKARRSWWGIEMLPVELREVHELAKQLRDESIAHFGHGDGIPVRPLVRETLVLQFVGNSPVTTFYVSRVQNRADIGARLEALIKTVKELARKVARERMTEVIEAIAQAGTEDDSLKDFVIGYKFDPSQFFVGHDAQNEISANVDDQGVSTSFSSIAVPKPARPA